MAIEAKYTVWATLPGKSDSVYVSSGHDDDMTDAGWFALKKGVIEVEMPSMEQMIPVIVKGLEKKIQAEYARCESNVKGIREEIATLLCLEAPDAN